MKTVTHTVTAYRRPVPVSDMFVPGRVTIAPVIPAVRSVPAFAIAVLLIAAIPTFMLPGGTISFFNDNENSTGNTFGAGPLDIDVSVDHDAAIIIIDQPGEVFIFTPTAIANSLPFRYKVSGQASGNAFFCPEIDAVGDAPLAYVGSVTSFTTADTDSLTPWSLTLSLNTPAPGVVDGQICTLDLTFEAYQVGGAVGTEYHDTEHIILTLTADPPVINEPASFTVTTLVSEEVADPGASTPPADEQPAEEPSEQKAAEPEVTEPEVVEPEPEASTEPQPEPLQDILPADSPEPVVVEEDPPPVEEVPTQPETPIE